RRRHTRSKRDWSSDVCSSDLLAEEHSCIIVGRCADYLLKDRSDAVRIFIHASQEFRLQRMSCLLQLSNQEVLKILKKTDRVRQRSEERRVGKECRYEWAEDVH